MNCDCKQALEAKLLEKLKQGTPDGANHSVSLSGYGLVIVGNKMGYRPCMDVSQSVDLPRKAGGFKNTKPKLNMFFSYCPFCGKSVNAQKPEDVEGGAACADQSTSSEMLAALIVARETICFDRNAYAEANTPKGGRRIDPHDRDVLADYDAALLQINAAIVKGGAA